MCVKDFHDHILKKDGYYGCEDGTIVAIMAGHLQQLHDKLVKEGLEKALQLLFRMMIFSENFDNVRFREIKLAVGDHQIPPHNHRKLHAQ